MLAVRNADYVARTPVDARVANPSPCRCSDPASPLIRAAFADDYRVMRRDIRLVLQSERDLLVIDEAADLPPATHLTKEYVPDVLVLDLGCGNGR